MRHGVKISLSLLLIFCIMALSFSAFAAIAPVTDVEHLAILYDIYLSTVGISPVFFIDGVASSESDAISLVENSALITDLWDAWQSTMPSSLQMSISEFIDATTVEYAVSPSGYNTVILDVTAVENFDKMTNWLLQSKLGQSYTTESDSLHYHTTGNFGDSLVSSYSTTGSFISCPIVSANPTYNDVVASGIYAGANNFGYDYYAASGTSNVYFALYHAYGNNPKKYAGVWISSSPFTCYAATQNGYGTKTIETFNSSLNNGVYVYSYYSYGLTPASYIPLYETVNDAITAFGHPTVASSTSLLVKPNKPEIYIPNTDDVNYLPKEKVATLTSKIGTPGSVVDPLSILNDLLNKASTNKPVVQDPFTDEPDPVINPLVPFDLPSLEFDFSGIWYYVVQWISSLRSGFTFIASTWSALPFDMVIPIYASAVVVIVVGTFKRFFS